MSAMQTLTINDGLPAHGQAELAQTRSKNYWFLAQFFLQRPDAQFIAGLQQAFEGIAPDTDDATMQQLIHATDELAMRDDSIAIEKEYTRLLRGLEEGYGPPPHYESVYRENRLVGDTTADVIRCYQQAGFGDIDPDAGPQDHIGVELKFMSLLCLQEYQAWQNHDAALAYEKMQLQQSFLQQHLMAWMPDFCQQLIEQSQHDFYTAIGRLTLDALSPEMELLDELSRELSVA